MMKIREFLQSDPDRAVSPVIGVILMVAITVILAAVIGTFVLGLGDQVQRGTAPSAQFTFDYDAGTSGSATDCLDTSSNDGDLTITHDGGDAIESSELYLKPASGGGNWVSDCNGGEDSNNKVTAGRQAEVEVDNDMTVRVVWDTPDPDKSSTVGKWDGPNA